MTGTRSFIRQLLPTLLICTAFAVGCSDRGDQWDRAVVSGSVSYQGEPIERGRIRFNPQEGTAGPVSVAMIENGQYRYDYMGGVPLGVHRVQIWALDPSMPEAPGPGGVPTEPILPAKYNDESDLEVTVKAAPDGMVQDFRLD